MLRFATMVLLSAPLCFAQTNETTAAQTAPVPAQDPAIYPTIPLKIPSSEFLKMYNLDGQPKPTYSVRLKKRFGERLNRAILPSTQTEAERTKWLKIMAELRRAVDRTVPSEKRLMLMNRAEARTKSILFEKKGEVSQQGAWAIATAGTAARHGFANRPCAEFVSEVLREAYARAGYSHTEDFNKEKKNVLSYSGGAASVTGLSNFLDKAGWVPWDASKYIPPAGAPMMHMSGTSPGHAYVSGGNQGRIIVDNAKPDGRDLSQSSRKLIAYMYTNGLFFLPPGINPDPWPVQPPQLPPLKLTAK